MGKGDININCNEIEELIGQCDMLLDMTKAKLREIQRASRDPNFLKSAVRSKYAEFSRKIDELLKAQMELTKKLDRENDG